MKTMLIGDGVQGERLGSAIYIFSYLERDALMYALLQHMDEEKNSPGTYSDLKKKAFFNQLIDALTKQT